MVYVYELRKRFRVSPVAGAAEIVDSEVSNRQKQ